METGGYDANFVDEPADYLKCIVCTLVLRNPVLFVDCGHRVCKDCFDRMKKDATQRKVKILCPHDRMEIVADKVFDDKGILRVILDFKVKCDNCSDGCGWVGELRDLQKHLDDICGFENNNNLTKLTKQLMKRMEVCEKKLNEKDDEIAKLRHEKDEEIVKLRHEKDEEIVKLRNEKDKEIAQLRHDILVSNDRINNLHQQVVELTKKFPPADLLSSNETAKPVQKAKVLHDYEPEQSDELRLTVGMIINIINSELTCPGWLEGEVDGKIGVFPENFVQLLTLEQSEQPIGHLFMNRKPYNNQVNSQSFIHSTPHIPGSHIPGAPGSHIAGSHIPGSMASSYSSVHHTNVLNLAHNAALHPNPQSGHFQGSSTASPIHMGANPTQLHPAISSHPSSLHHRQQTYDLYSQVNPLPIEPDRFIKYPGY